LATITEVAREAGVGVGTVSRVMNGSTAVRDETRRRVLDAIARLGYAPNAAARALSTGRTATVGVVAPFFTRASVVTRLRGISRALDAGGYRLVLFDVERPEQAPAIFQELAGGGRVDAVLAVTLCPDEPELGRFAASGIPVVLVDREHPRLASVTIDDVSGGRLATDHLLGLGHERIGFVGDIEPGPTRPIARRHAGYEAALRAAGMRPDHRLVCRALHGREPTAAATRALLALESPPTAIFAASDDQALAVLEVAAQDGVEVPGDLSVVGFDDVEAARWAGLTTVAQPLEESGVQGAELVLAALAGSPVGARALDVRLELRVTTAVPGRTRPRPMPHEVRMRTPISTRGSSCRSD
jgi:DNA-binding LacI/PurR family transcriptional regulator